MPCVLLAICCGCSLTKMCYFLFLPSPTCCPRKTIREAMKLIQEQHDFVETTRITGFRRGDNGEVTLSLEMNMNTTIAAAELAHMGPYTQPMLEPQFEDQVMASSLPDYGMSEDEMEALLIRIPAVMNLWHFADWKEEMRHGGSKKAEEVINRVYAFLRCRADGQRNETAIRYLIENLQLTIGRYFKNVLEESKDTAKLRAAKRYFDIVNGLHRYHQTLANDGMLQDYKLHDET